MNSPPKKYSACEKAKVALEAHSGRYATAQLRSRYGIHASQINRWVAILRAGVPDLYKDRGSQEEKEKDALIEDLYKKIGQLNIELEWVKKNLLCSVDPKRQLMDPNVQEVSLRRQCELLDLNRLSYYYESGCAGENISAIAKDPNTSRQTIRRVRDADPDRGTKN